MEPTLPTPKRTIERPAERALTPLEQAKLRAKEIRGHLEDLDQGTDDFFVPPEFVPEGWSYEWKRFSVHGQEDPAYQVQLARMGWTAVPAKRHPKLMPEGDKYETVIRKGMILMERPSEITEEIRKIDKKRAKDQVRVKEEQLAASPQGQFERNNKDASLVKIKKSVEPIPIPDN